MKEIEVLNSTITQFEHLSNEILYEIFEYLNHFHVYQAFWNLNIRLFNTVTHGNYPINIITSSTLSPSLLKQYNHDVIPANTSQISTLGISHSFMYDFVFSSIGQQLSKFNHLKTLILIDIESKYLKIVLNQLQSLVSLVFLTITSIDAIDYKNTVFKQIFRLSKLKYCKLSLKGWSKDEILPSSNNIYSRIEDLNIIHTIYYDELPNILSYVPQLQRLTLHSLLKSDANLLKTPSFQFRLKYLTHLSCQLDSIDFSLFKQMIINHFHSIEILRITINYGIDLTYLEANEWQEFILSHMPKLRIFYINYRMSFGMNVNLGIINNEMERFKSKVEQFNTLFWLERQWVFAYQFYRSRSRLYAMFYSINPYRTKEYTLYESIESNMSMTCSNSNFKYVRHVSIQNGNSTNDYVNYNFPNANELTIENMWIDICESIEHIIPFERLTKLNIDNSHISFEKINKLLRLASYVKHLTFVSIVPYDNDGTLCETTELYQSVAKKNIITNVSCTALCQLNQIRFLLTLFPRIEHLRMHTSADEVQLIARFLLDKIAENNLHLHSICYLDCSFSFLELLNKVMKSTRSSQDYIFKQMDNEVYLWI